MVSRRKTKAQLTRWKAAGSGEKRALVRLNQGRISRLSRRKAEARHRAGKAAGSGRPSTVFSAEVCLSSVRRIFVCAGIVTALCVFVLSPVFYPVIMGQETSTPLSLRTDHFSDFKSRAQNLSVLVKKSKLITFCSTEWPTFHVGWTSEGTFDLGTVHQVRDIIF